MDHRLWAETLAWASEEGPEEQELLFELLFKGTTPQDYGRFARSMEMVDLFEDVEHIFCPVLVIAHENQGHVALSQEFAAALPNAEFVQRRSQYEDVETEYQLISDFLGLEQDPSSPQPLPPSPKARAALRADGGFDNPDGLTPRELEVLMEVARGARNSEIADELTISPATVTRHISNLLNKTGLSNRTELARYATDHGLAGDS